MIAASSVLGSGQSEVLALSFDQPGRYVFVCTMPGHYEQGRRGTLEAVAP